MSLYRKYRPGSFADVTGQEHVKTTVQNQIMSDSVAHAYLFMGPRGVGKTTIARLIAKAVNCEKRKGAEPCNACNSCKEILGGAALDVIEIDAASHTDVDNVRENIVKAVRFAPNRLKFKVFIIDEVHMLSTSAFNALLKTLEEPPAHAVFILATTEIHKVPDTIISRCQRYDFKRIPVPLLVKRLSEIAKAENVEIDDAVVHEVARHSDGCARDAESLLGQLFALGEKKITLETASLILPATTSVLTVDFLSEILKGDAEVAMRQIGEFVEQGMDMPRFADDSIELLRAMLFASLGNAVLLEESYGKDVQDRVKALLPSCQSGQLTRLIDAFLEARGAMRHYSIPQLALELAVVKFAKPIENAPQASVPDQDFKEQEVDSGREEASSPPPPPPVPPAVEVQEAPVVEAKEMVADSVPVVDIDEVKRKWPEVFQQLKACNASLPLMVQAGELSSVEGDKVEISFEYALYADQLNQDKNRRLLEGVMQEVMGKKLRITAKHASSEENEAVDELLTEFGGVVAEG